MPYLQQVNAQSQSGSSGFHRPSKVCGPGVGLRGAWYDPDTEQKLKAHQTAKARGLEKDADVDIHAFRRSNAQGQAQIVQSDYNWLYVEAENEAEQEQEHDYQTGGPYQVEYGSPATPGGGQGPGPAVGGPWPQPRV